MKIEKKESEMSNRPTPETDAFIVQNTTNEGPTGVKWRAHAERLERERDEAREELENYKAASIHSCHHQCERPMCVLRRERDEAREFCFQLVELVAYGLGQNGSFWSQKAMSQAREAISKAKALEAAK